jgi:hypothetical protein
MWTVSVFFYARSNIRLSVAVNRVIANTWHHTLEDAYHQAEFQYGVEKDEWADVVDI